MKIDYTTKQATENRAIRVARAIEPALGPLEKLPGTWANVHPQHRLDNGDGPADLFQGEGTLTGAGQSPFDGRGWNSIALPFFEEGQFRNYRLLMNQYNEVLRFKKVDENIPNRGITQDRDGNADQLVGALDYEQVVSQIAAEEFGKSGQAGVALLPIHHEPGFVLHMRDQRIDGINIARLATIPHGNAVTALGRFNADVDVTDGPPSIAPLSGFPEGVSDDVASDVDGLDPKDSANARAYLLPYAKFARDPFKGVVAAAGFPGFGPANANQLLQIGLPGNVVKTTALDFDTELFEAGIVNIPFVERQADAASMKVKMWIMELDEEGIAGHPRMILAYSQFIFLDFFRRRDGKPGLIRWPHISINMMEKVEEPDNSEQPMEAAAIS